MVLIQYAHVLMLHLVAYLFW